MIQHINCIHCGQSFPINQTFCPKCDKQQVYCPSWKGCPCANTAPGVTKFNSLANVEVPHSSSTVETPFYNNRDKLFEVDNLFKLKLIEEDKRFGAYKAPIILPLNVQPEITELNKIPVKKDDVDSIIGTSTPNGKFRIWARYYIVTFKYHLDKEAVIAYFTSLGAVVVRVAHEIGTKKIDYEHTHVYLDFGKQFHSQNQRIFDKAFRPGHYRDYHGYPTTPNNPEKNWVLQDHVSDQPHPNIGPICKQKHLNRIYEYMCKYDHSNDDMKLWVKQDTICEDIWDCTTIQEALLTAEKPSDIGGIIQAFAHKPEPKPEEDPIEFLWQKHLLNMLEGNGSRRKIHWIFDQKGGMGKTDFTKHARAKFGKDVLLMSQFGGARDCATVVSNALENGWTGKILIVDLPRQAEKHAIYEPLEMIKNGVMTSIKYNGKTNVFVNKYLIVLANFYPDVSNMTWDRWQIWDRTKYPAYFNFKISGDEDENLRKVAPNWDGGDKRIHDGLKYSEQDANILNQVKDWPKEDLQALMNQISNIFHSKLSIDNLYPTNKPVDPIPKPKVCSGCDKPGNWVYHLNNNIFNDIFLCTDCYNKSADPQKKDLTREGGF